MKKLHFGLLFMAITTLFACSHDDMQEQESSSNGTTSARKANGQIPFTVENVQNALPIVLRYYDSYNPTISQKFRDYKVEPTHVYYKFTPADRDRKSTRLNSSHVKISYAVFCLKKKN